MQHKDKTQIIKYQIEPHNINSKELNKQDKQASRSHNYIIVTKHETDKKNGT